MTYRFRLAWCIFLFAGLAGCKENSSKADAALKTVSDHFPIRVGSAVVNMQVAITEPEMEKGLMFRKDLGADDGMIFLYNKPRKMTFWMHNTPSPLDIGFFLGTGELREIYSMLPFNDNTTASHADNIQFALEMPVNWYREHGIRPGAMLDIAGLAAAIKARGYNPERFNLK